MGKSMCWSELELFRASSSSGERSRITLSGSTAGCILSEWEVIRFIFCPSAFCWFKRIKWILSDNEFGESKISNSPKENVINYQNVFYKIRTQERVPVCLSPSPLPLLSQKDGDYPVPFRHLVGNISYFSCLTLLVFCLYIILKGIITVNLRFINKSDLKYLLSVLDFACDLRYILGGYPYSYQKYLSRIPSGMAIYIILFWSYLD